MALLHLVSQMPPQLEQLIQAIFFLWPFILLLRLGQYRGSLMAFSDMGGRVTQRAQRLLLLFKCLFAQRCSCSTGGFS